MNWDAVGAIGEVAGAIGVIATLIYLSVQIRQNTRAMRGATLDSITERKQFELRWSSDISQAWRKSIIAPSSLTDDESWQITEWMTAAFVARQNEYFQFKQGLIDAEAWKQSEKVIQMALSSEWGQAWWREFGPTTFLDSFIAVVNRIVDESELDYRDVLTNLEIDKRTDEGSNA